MIKDRNPVKFIMGPFYIPVCSKSMFSTSSASEYKLEICIEFRAQTTKSFAC